MGKCFFESPVRDRCGFLVYVSFCLLQRIFIGVFILFEPFFLAL